MCHAISVNAISQPNEYPESKHNYSNNFNAQWTYSYEWEADCLFVTFSQDTYFGPGGADCYDAEKDDYLCDYLKINFEAENRTKYYFADDLAGKTILVPGNKFSIELTTDSKDRYYGFKISEISTEGSLGENVSVTYKISEDYKEKHFYTLDEDGAFAIAGGFKNKIFGDKAIIGWKDEKGHRYLYKNYGRSSGLSNLAEIIYKTYYDYTDVFELKPGDEITLTPVFADLSIAPSETFSFGNDWDIFEDGYRMTDAHTERLKKCYLSATWKNQFGILGVPLGLLLPGIYQNVPWAGSCCGFPIAILMQHYGMIDLRSEQNVATVSQIEETDKILSALNFYNAVTPAAVVCSNKAPKPGTDTYKAQIKNLYETVSAGKPAVCFINCGYIDGVSYKSVSKIITGVLSKGIKYLVNAFESTHCILLTGTYTDGEGNRIFIGYDENEATYSKGQPQTYKIIGDYEDVVDASYFEDSLGSIAWLNDVSCLESFKADGEMDSSAWYSYYRANRDNL